MVQILGVIACKDDQIEVHCLYVKKPDLRMTYEDNHFSTDKPQDCPNVKLKMFLKEAGSNYYNSEVSFLKYDNPLKSKPKATQFYAEQ